MAAERPVVLVVDDDPSMRESLRDLVDSVGLEARVFGSAPEFLQAKRPDVPGCLVLDVRLPGSSGLHFQQELAKAGVQLPVIFITGHGDIPMAVEALKKGAFDFVEKPSGDVALVERVTRALAVDAARQDADSKDEETAARLASLSDREREVMQRVAAGKLNKVIADELCISVRTVEVHRARVFGKLGVRSAAEVATLLARGR
jgi:two-component system response regulator DctR